jgi:hypothetical protein
MTIPIGSLTAAVTLPGYLIEFDFSPPRYFSTRGLQNWASKAWASSGWTFDADKLSLPGGDPAMARLILSQGVVGKRVRVWIFYGNFADDTNTQLVFDGVADGAPSLVGSVVVTLFDQSIAVMYGPRARIRADGGFSVLPQKGLKIKWNGTTFQLKDNPT